MCQNGKNIRTNIRIYLYQKNIPTNIRIYLYQKNDTNMIWTNIHSGKFLNIFEYPNICYTMLRTLLGITFMKMKHAHCIKSDKEVEITCQRCINSAGDANLTDNTVLIQWCTRKQKKTQIMLSISCSQAVEARWQWMQREERRRWAVALKRILSGDSLELP